MKKTIALILAGGKGTRMDVLCQMRPKPALPFAGLYRVMDFSLTNCVRSDVSDIAVVVDYQRDYMREYLRDWHLANTGAARLDVLPPPEGSYTGTADAVYQNLEYLEKQDADTVLVLAGDHVYEMDYRQMIDFHRDRNADVTVGAVHLSDEAHRFGAITIDGKGRVRQFLEKSPMAKSKLVSMGIYVFDKAILAKRLREDAADPRSVHDFGYGVLPRMVASDRVYAYGYQGYWRDIGTTEAYYLASMELLRGTPCFIFNGGRGIMGERGSLPVPLTIEAEGIVNSIVSPGCQIRGRVINSILSPGVYVAEQTIVRDSILLAGAMVDYHSVVKRCIVDEGAKIGKFCFIGFSLDLNRTPSHGDDVTVLGRDVTVPDCTAIGRRCRIMQGVGPATFATNIISSGTILALPER